MSIFDVSIGFRIPSPSPFEFVGASRDPSTPSFEPPCSRSQPGCRVSDIRLEGETLFPSLLSLGTETAASWIRTECR